MRVGQRDREGGRKRVERVGGTEGERGGETEGEREHDREKRAR